MKTLQDLRTPRRNAASGIALAALLLVTTTPAFAQFETQSGTIDGFARERSGGRGVIQFRAGRSLAHNPRRLNVNYTLNPPSRKPDVEVADIASDTGDLDTIALITDSPLLRAHVNNHLQSAKQGSTTSQILMGDFHLNGQLVKRNFNKALAWYRKAVDNHSVLAMAKTGAAHEYTFGAAQNHVRAYAWYTVAANQGMKAARYLAEKLVDNGRLTLEAGAAAVAEVERSLPESAANLESASTVEGRENRTLAANTTGSAH